MNEIVFWIIVSFSAMNLIALLTIRILAGLDKWGDIQMAILDNQFDRYRDIVVGREWWWGPTAVVGAEHRVVLMLKRTAGEGGNRFLKLQEKQDKFLFRYVFFMDTDCIFDAHERFILGIKSKWRPRPSAVLLAKKPRKSFGGNGRADWLDATGLSGSTYYVTVSDVLYGKPIRQFHR